MTSALHVVKVNLGIHGRPVASGGGPGGHVPTQFLADQLTLSQPAGAHYPHPVLRALPDFQTLRRPCGLTSVHLGCIYWFWFYN